MKKLTIILLFNVLLLSATPVLAAPKYQLTGEVKQEIVDCSTEVHSTTYGYVDALSSSIKPQYDDSVIKITAVVPRIDVSLISGQHSARLAAVRVVDEKNKSVGNVSFALGRILSGSSAALATHTGHINGTVYYPLNSKATKTFRLQFTTGIPDITESKIRGDRGEYCLILQEMRSAQSNNVSFLNGLNLMAQAISSLFSLNR